MIVGRQQGGEETLAARFTAPQMAPIIQEETLCRKPLSVSTAWLMGDLSTPAQYVMVLYLDAVSVPPPHHW